jgi:probable phosphoglycerate mutase
MAGTKIVLVRHGETQWNVARRIQGHSDSPLTAVGVAQARALAERLRQEELHAVHASDLGRVRETVAHLIEKTGHGPIFAEDLRERCYGVFEGKTMDECELHHPGQWSIYRGGDPMAVPPGGGESVAQFQDRIVSALERVAKECDGQTVVVAAHGGVCGALFRHVMRLPPGTPRSWSLYNASINRFHYHKGKWQLEVWGDVSHLKGETLQDL